MKSLATYLALARRSALFLVACTVLGMILGAGAALARPATETSTGLTTLTSANVKLPVEGTYSVNQMIRVTMPGYVAYAKDASVIEAGANAAGIDTTAAGNGLAVVRQPDASVIEWTMKTKAGAGAQKALAAELAQFDKVVEQASPKGEKGETLVKVVHNQPATDAVVSRTSPLLAGLAGALAGFVGALAVVIYRGMHSKVITGRDAIESAFGTPVVADMTPGGQEPALAWRYVAAALGREREPGRVLLLGSRFSPRESDATALGEAVREVTPVLRPDILRRTLSDSMDVAQVAGSCDGVVLELVLGRDSVRGFASEIQALHHICNGPVLAVLVPDDRAASADRARAV